MAVYTHLDQTTLNQYFQPFGFGDITEVHGIQGGVENTNYRIHTATGAWVLTLFEHHQAHEVREFVRLARHLNSAGFVVPAPLADQNGEWLHELAGKPAILCEMLKGHHIERPTPSQCREIGELLARLHLGSAVLEQPRANSRGFGWWANMHSNAKALLDDANYQLLDDEYQFQMSQRDVWKSLPRGWIHGDLFTDNVLFEGNGDDLKVGAVLDWYNACEGVWLYDLAIVANDWCSEKNGDWIVDNRDALLAGYQSVRPFTAAEEHNWNTLLRGAATRFWLSRLETVQHQQSVEGMNANIKDPNEYRDKLLARRG